MDLSSRYYNVNYVSEASPAQVEAARVIADQIEFTRQFNNGKIEQHRLAATVQIAHGLADMFERLDPQFSRVRFLEAALGVTPASPFVTTS